MSYQVYTTDTFIIEAKASKDADVSLVLFTEQLGIVFAHARSARLERSKLRFSLQSMSFSSISMVKGREVWRVTSAKKHINLYDKRLQSELQDHLAECLLSIYRFCPREVPESQVFKIMKDHAGFIFKEGAQKSIQATRQGAYLRVYKDVFLFKLLYALGYISPDESMRKEIIEKDISSAIEWVGVHMPDITSHINQAITQSNL